ncbi:MAG: magnesium/cobalt transporter CorA [Pirellulales bacterium]|nr:magnesium/cobalt transporter CorA [Pirellulales bacterium]
MHRRKRKARFQRRTQPGALPGSVVVDPLAKSPKLHLLSYGSDRCEERMLGKVSEAREYLDKYPVTWINVEGLGDATIIGQVGEMFGLHRLALEDVVNVHQRAKVEEYRDHLFIVTRIPRQNAHFDSEQVSIFLGKNYVVSFLEDPGDCFEQVRQRVRAGQGHARVAGPDYLAYALIDAAVDAYFPVLEHQGDRLDTLEDLMLAKPSAQTIRDLHGSKSILRSMRRVLWPQREALNVLVRDHSSLVRDETRVYFRDCYDHTVQLIDLLEVDRERCADLLDLYLSNASNRLNEVMRVLTVISTLFIPLTFIVGIYGMNFNTKTSPWNMPELEWYYGYPLVWLTMIVVVVGQFIFFVRKGWIGSSLPPEKHAPEGEQDEVQHESHDHNEIGRPSHQA